jgi:hypothetical protein
VVQVEVSGGKLKARQTITVTVEDVEEFQVPSAVQIPSGTLIQGDKHNASEKDERPTREVRSTKVSY